MRLDSRDRLFTIRASLDDARLVNRELAVIIPVPVSTNYDVETDSGRDVSSGDSSGQDPQFFVHRLYGNLRQVDELLITYGHVPPGAMTGDTYLTINLRDKAVFENARNNPEAYALIDGERWRIASVNVAGVGHEEEGVVTVKRFSPRWIAPGY